MSEYTPNNASGIAIEEVKKKIGADRAPRSRRARTLRYIVLAAVFLFLVTLGLLLMRGATNATDQGFETAEAKRGDVRVTVTATGTLQATTTVEVGAEVTGRVLKVNVDANDIVKKGQVLAVIDPEQLQAAVTQVAAQVGAADAAVRLARATAAEAKLTLSRVRLQVAEGLATTKDLETASASAERADANVDSAIANVTLAKAALSQAQSKLDKTTILSPINGIVLSRSVEPGQTVTAGFTTPILFKLAEDLTQMRLNVDVDEADVGRVRDGLEATFSVDAYPERTFTSQVMSVRNEAKVSQNVVTYQAVLSVDNSLRLLRPGMTCTATIVSETHRDVLVVPNAALRFAPKTPQGPFAGNQKQVGSETDHREKQRVWLLSGGKPVPLPVRASATDGVVTEIVSGELQPGVSVIVDVRDVP
jgi:HlyD family secretion protein